MTLVGSGQIRSITPTIGKYMNGKGSRRRPEDNDKFRQNYERIFRDPVHLVDVAESCSECKGGCNLCKHRGHFDPGWYFWDETWTMRYGPYPSKKIANEMLEGYIKQL